MSVGKRAAAVVLATALAGGVAAATTPASASTSQGYITAGSGAITSDWSDEGNLSTTSHAHSNATALWQAVLYADGYLTASGIDCKFGPSTKAATKKFQSHFHAGTADGIAGKKTFSNADNRLVHDYVSGGYEVAHYKGIKRKVWFKINVANRRYQVRKSTSIGYKDASYTKATACG
ncbi:peptidoglycan-binding domain-containing protein [Streptomyces shenzhenensis]|uniref:peptidoglycan-binding domain-containing protein n=1 Tax=Streptomyces shenzhenensis TaxID=943815 RepID=UPI001F38CC15|nr:peptidoglycan-binding protein [Streptomyces shenzhenensis]